MDTRNGNSSRVHSASCWEIQLPGKLKIKEEIKQEIDLDNIDDILDDGLVMPSKKRRSFELQYEGEYSMVQPGGDSLILPQYTHYQIESPSPFTSPSSYKSITESCSHLTSPSFYKPLTYSPTESLSSLISPSHYKSILNYPAESTSPESSPPSCKSIKVEYVPEASDTPDYMHHPQKPTPHCLNVCLNQLTPRWAPADTPVSTRPCCPPANHLPTLIPLSPQWKAEPQARIVEHPKENSLRFRYECEGRSAGSLQGVNSAGSIKTFPCIEIVNYVGPAVVVVSCVNATGPPLTHPHNLVGKDCKKGVCTVNINNEAMFCVFQNLGIQCVRRKDVEKSLNQRQAIRVDPFKQGFQHKNAPNRIDLNAVRLCFQVFIIGEKGTFTNQLEPVLSTPINDAKARKSLEILELSDDHSSVEGGRKIIILCEKVTKEDIQVNFFEEDEEGNRIWEALGEFHPSDVYKQYGICLRTPKYKNRAITSKVQANIELRKSSNRTDTSDPLPFYFTPSTSSRAITPSIPSPSPPFQSRFSMMEVCDSISEEDLPTILTSSYISTF